MLNNDDSFFDMADLSLNLVVFAFSGRVYNDILPR